jgi:hypothetical protein
MIAEIVPMCPGCEEGGEHLLIIPCRLGSSLTRSVDMLYSLDDLGMRLRFYNIGLCHH